MSGDILRRFAVLAFIGLAGCYVPTDRQIVTDFEPTETGFKYRAPADTSIWPPDDPEAEANRMEWLERYLTDNAMCPNGYRITTRNVVVLRDAPLGTSYDVFYEGECA